MEPELVLQFFALLREFGIWTIVQVIIGSIIATGIVWWTREVKIGHGDVTQRKNVANRLNCDGRRLKQERHDGNKLTGKGKALRKNKFSRRAGMIYECLSYGRPYFFF